MFQTIANADLRPEDLPASTANWETIGTFALAFNGYHRWPDSPSCGDIANDAKEHYRETGQLPQDLDVLRSCLFFEQRRWRHFGDVPEGEDLAYIKALVEAIRGHVQQRR